MLFCGIGKDNTKKKHAWIRFSKKLENRNDRDRLEVAWSYLGGISEIGIFRACVFEKILNLDGWKGWKSVSLSRDKA